MKKLLFLIIISCFFSCSKKVDEKTGAEVEYTKAHQALMEKDYTKAAESFEKIDDNYPFSKWAAKAQAMALYARYKNHENEKMLQIIDDFLHLNPNSEYVPYMLYMRGLSYYEQIPDIKRAQNHTQEASFTFRELIARFPLSNYAGDAKEKLDFIDEHLAGYKMEVGRYNLNQANYVGAFNNFTEVMERYRSSKQVPESLFRLNEIYSKLGLKDEANKIKNELQQRFPESYWAKHP